MVEDDSSDQDFFQKADRDLESESEPEEEVLKVSKTKLKKITAEGPF